MRMSTKVSKSDLAGICFVFIIPSLFIFSWIFNDASVGGVAGLALFILGIVLLVLDALDLD